MTKQQIAAALAERGITLTASQIKKTPIAALQARLDAAPKAKRSKGTNVAAKRDFKPFRDGTKQAAMFALMTRPEGATMGELAAVAPNWKVGTIKSAFHWDFAAQHGVGVRSSFDAEGVERFHAVVTEASA